MTGRSVIHDTFTIGRTYPSTPSRVFAAFASEDAKNARGGTGDIGAPADAEPSELDFRVGGRERFTVRAEGSVYRYNALLRHRAGSADRVQLRDVRRRRQDLGVGRRHRGRQEQRRRSADLDRAGADLDGIDGPQAPALRKEGTTEMLNGLTRYLTAQPAS